MSETDKLKATANVAGRNKRIVMREFILDYLKKNTCASATDEEFHEQFYTKFGGARKETMWGAQPVSKAMSLLKEMYDDGTLDRVRLGLGSNWQPGFPKWNYSYHLNA